MSATTTLSPKAVIFDAYGTLFDVHSVIAAAEQMFPGHGDALSQLWRQKQIEYTQLRTLAAPASAPGVHYRRFWDITLDALRFAARKLHLTLSRAAEKRLMDEYACLSAFPDAVPVLRQLRDAPSRSSASVPVGGKPGSRLGLAILSNGNPQMLDIAVKSAGMTGLFDHVLSVDTVRAYKPSPAAYSLGTQAFDAEAREIVFVSSNGWDVAGASWFGFTTFWLNRQNAPAEELGVTPHGAGGGMNDLLAFLKSLASPGRTSGTGNTGNPGGSRTRHSPGA
ncbi:(S)-2-haloacid dehalogenase [Paraburkholderia domus]|uniref:(S)-2-haloacid dehalogenase n=1 Tax=Paraburkholderia domus TaxID=2793075 RepID=UPI001911CA1B|nr:(S)-2-haloacid dehalogenase [Paraburkholderia domus]MBK5180544.1 (S)-2-haloacid dehalogenase [Burkholderia sp. R-69749]MCI0146151.1 HAD-IA family hydrolase [Paraburkholderia sediminicola]CAE6799984.1 2-haloalkanoic acid dehalogenase [Paraburkholderia domus]